MSLAEIVQVTITRETKAVSRAGFGTMLILDSHMNFTERTRIYTDAATMLTDGFSSTDPTYIAAAAAFSQNPSVPQVKVGRRHSDVVIISVDTAVDSTDYTITINGTDFTIDSGVAATPTSIATALVGAINGGSEPVSAIDNADGSFDIASDTPGQAFTLALVGTNMSIQSFLTAGTVADDLAAIKLVDDDWYALVLASKVEADVDSAAQYIESENKIFITSSNDVDIYDSGSTTDIAAKYNAAGYERTAVLFSASDTQYPEAAWLGLQLTTDPGSSTWMFKTLSGITVDTLTATQSNNIRNKEANTYESISGVSITREGTMANGEYIDIIRGIDWIQARMSERIYSRFVNLPKIPFTDGGIAIIEGEIRAQLQQGVDNGLLTDNPQYTVTVPLASEVDTTEKANRLLTNVNFQATLAGAIHKVIIQGAVSL